MISWKLTELWWLGLRRGNLSKRRASGTSLTLGFRRELTLGSAETQCTLEISAMMTSQT
jgi:hypothetical protein